MIKTRSGRMAKNAILPVLLCVAFATHAAACDLGDPPVWDSEGKIAEAQAFDFIAVVRFDTTQKAATSDAARQSWVDDVPSDTTGVEAICDRVQLETPLPMSGDEDLPLTMMQGERMHPDTDMKAFPGLAARVAADQRLVKTAPGPVFVGLTDQQDVNWRPKLLAAARKVGTIDASRWMIGLPGGLYLVPLKP